MVFVCVFVSAFVCDRVRCMWILHLWQIWLRKQSTSPSTSFQASHSNVYSQDPGAVSTLTTCHRCFPEAQDIPAHWPVNSVWSPDRGKKKLMTIYVNYAWHVWDTSETLTGIFYGHSVLLKTRSRANRPRNPKIYSIAVSSIFFFFFYEDDTLGSDLVQKCVLCLKVHWVNRHQTWWPLG